MKLSDFDYRLPQELIAQKAANPKDSSRLMVLRNNSIEHRHFYNLVDYLKKGYVLVINETKVSKARICGKKITGGKAELILCRKLSDKKFECRIKGNRTKLGNKYCFGRGLNCRIASQDNDIFAVEFNKPISQRIINEFFELPTPPYVKRKVEEDSEYQTVYSKKEGSLAAPTAGLHFTDALIERIKNKGVIIAKVCLHIDFGTFLPVKGNIKKHKMQQECFEIDKKNAGIINNRAGRLIVVGTTSVRALESATDSSGKIIPGKSMTSLFIYPGYKFKTKIDAMITNFHFPKSTLLMLVSAYYGRETVLNAYKEAIKKRYRFYSLGDAMILIK